MGKPERPATGQGVRCHPLVMLGVGEVDRQDWRPPHNVGWPRRAHGCMWLACERCAPVCPDGQYLRCIPSHIIALQLQPCNSKLKSTFSILKFTCRSILLRFYYISTHTLCYDWFALKEGKHKCLVFSLSENCLTLRVIDISVFQTYMLFSLKQTLYFLPCCM